MAITSYQTTRAGSVTVVTVTSDLADTVYYHWYVDGQHVDQTLWPFKAFYLGVGQQARVEVIDTNDPDYDWQSGAPEGWPSRRTLWWTSADWPSLGETDLDHYRIDQKTDGDWEAAGRVQHNANQWEYRFLTARLADLTEYTWRIVPVDRAGNDGTPLELRPEKIVRTPDAPRFAIAFDQGTTKVTFSAAT